MDVLPEASRPLGLLSPPEPGGLEAGSEALLCRTWVRFGIPSAFLRWRQGVHLLIRAQSRSMHVSLITVPGHSRVKTGGFVCFHTL